MEKGPAGRVAAGRNHQSGIRSGGSSSGRQLQFRWTGASIPVRCGPTRSATPAAGEQDGLLWFDPAAFVPSAGREYGTAPVVPFRLPGRHQWDITVSKNGQPRWHDSPPVQGRPDQRIQSDAVPRRAYDCARRPRRRRANTLGPRDSAKSRARDRRARSSLASDSIGEINRDRHESTLEVLLDGEPADRASFAALSSRNHRSSPCRQPSSRPPRRYRGSQRLCRDHRASSIGEEASKPRTSRGRC